MEEIFKNKMLLVVAPHPDDEVLGCGGLIGKVKKEGGKVYVLIMTAGVSPLYGSTYNLEGFLKETADAMKFMNIDDYEINLGPEFNNKLDTLNQLKLMDIIERDSKLALNKIKPDIVAIPFPSAHQDHVVVYQAALRACRPRPAELKPFQSIVLSYEYGQNQWASSDGFKPNFYLNIENFIDFKCQALSFYKSQLRPFPQYISEEAVRTLAKMRGIDVGVKAAEAFQVHRILV
ncbi:MAG: PIG-L family deacetylase [Candidatus Aenigmarchaeota archaeon]|nr:PIG-L family deacetylase [Candidatus Aenigmarchaeota archaeon]